MYCRKCGTQFDGNFCPNCGEPAKTVQETDKSFFTVPEQPKTDSIATKMPFYSRTWFIILVTFCCCFPLGIFLMWKYKKFNKPTRIVITLLFIIMTGIVMVSPRNPQQDLEIQDVSSDIENKDQHLIVFDAAQFYTEENGEYRPFHESEVIELIGEPESIEEWDYTSPTGLIYPIRALTYEDGEYVYEFNNDYLLRIQIFKPFEYEERDSFIEMFNLPRYSDTTIDDNGLNYHARRCGVYDLWLMDITDTTVGTTYITYFSGVFD